MKELLSLRSNFFAAKDADGKTLSQVELILILSETIYKADACGEVNRSREVTHCRFAASPESLRKLSAVIINLADECAKEWEEKK